MSEHREWLNAETRRWVDEQIVSKEQADRICALYPKSQSLSWGLVVFSSIGAVVIGLGVILLFAHNWDRIPRFGKLGLVFIPLIAAHLYGLCLKKEGWRIQLAEAMHVLGTMAFGSGIWLVAQIYNINEHFPAGFLIWGLGAYSLAWILKSTPQGILAAVLLVIWNGAERFRFETTTDWAPVLLLGLALLAWRQRSCLLLAFSLAGLYLALLFNGSLLDGSLGTCNAIYSFSALLFGVALLLQDREQLDGRSKVLGFFGATGFFAISYLHSLYSAERSLWADSSASRLSGTFIADLYTWLPFFAAMGAWAWLVLRLVRDKSEAVRPADWIYPIAVLYSQIFLPYLRPFGLLNARHFAGNIGYSTPFIVFNLVCLALAFARMIRGCRSGRLQPTIVGSLMLSLIVISRFFDLPGSLASRGVVFVALGAVLFTEGFYYRKVQQERFQEGQT